MNENTRCLITDLKEGEDFSVPMSHIHQWIMDNIEDVINGQYCFNGTFKLNTEIDLSNDKQQELKL
tara:strand:- start:372 stop:569 length:198 start_codon:yes stop_codon:yes gene_type:complete